MQPIQIGKNHTLYAIKAFMTEEQKEIAVGRLGSFTFHKGLYVYVGSAKRNLRSRVERHIRKEKTMRWHFDYLRPYLEIAAVETFSGDEGECGLFQRLMREYGGIIPARGFGSSDCRCPAHLFFVPGCERRQGMVTYC